MSMSVYVRISNIANSFLTSFFFSKIRGSFAIFPEQYRQEVRKMNFSNFLRFICLFGFGFGFGFVFVCFFIY